MSEAPDALSACEKAVESAEYGVLVAHLVVPDPQPRPSNWDGTREDYFVFKKNGQVVLVEVTSRSPMTLMRVDPRTPKGAETWSHVSKLGADIAVLLKDG
jgi:hypothetical protein